MHVDQRHGAAAGERCERHCAGQGRVHRAADTSLRRPGWPDASRRRGREQGDHDRGDRRRDRAGRCRRRPRRGPVQPPQVRDRRTGPELGPGAGGCRNYQCRIRARPAQRCHQRRLGVQGRRAGGGPVRGRPVGPRRPDHRGARSRPARSGHPDDGPDRRVRAPQLGVLDMTNTITENGAVSKAATLIEALPWLERFHGTIVVLKYGGNAMTDDDLRVAFAQDVVFLRYAGLLPVVVHGGGPQINAQLDRLGMEATFAGGLRVTTKETMDVVRMVLTGQVNREIVGLINAHGPFAVGLSGEDAHLLTARRIHAEVGGEHVDLGQVGEVHAVNPGAVRALLADGRIPVISSVARSASGVVLNVNAATAAAAIAIELGAAKLVLLTDVAGLYPHWTGEDAASATKARPISQLTADELAAMLPGLSDGMIP